MSYQNSHIGKVYYHVMKGSRYILADERNKKKLLDTVFHIYQENRWRMYAFCVTDDSAHFMAEAETYQAVRRETGRACDEFFQRCGEKIPRIGGIMPGFAAANTGSWILRGKPPAAADISTVSLWRKAMRPDRRITGGAAIILTQETMNGNR